jgi:hypothetical protein
VARRVRLWWQYAALLVKPISGEPPKLGLDQMPWIARAVCDNSPQQFKFEFISWTLSLIGELIKRRFDKFLSLASVRGRPVAAWPRTRISSLPCSALSVWYWLDGGLRSREPDVRPERQKVCKRPPAFGKTRRNGVNKSVPTCGRPRHGKLRMR